jgi:predicted DsbA family dithiol-disulfide isomerase
MHDKIFTNQRTLSPKDLTAHAKAIGLDLNQFSQCLDGGKNTQSVRAGLALAERVGVDGTPTFVIAVADPGNPKDTNVKVLSIISGAQPYTVFKTVLDKALSTQ